MNTIVPSCQSKLWLKLHTYIVTLIVDNVTAKGHLSSQMPLPMPFCVNAFSQKNRGPLPGPSEIGLFFHVLMLFLMLGCLLILHTLHLVLHRVPLMEDSLNELIRYILDPTFDIVWHIQSGGRFLPPTVWFCRKNVVHGTSWHNQSLTKPAPSKHPKARALFKKYGGNWNSYLHGRHEKKMHGTSWTYMNPMVQGELLVFLRS